MFSGKMGGHIHEKCTFQVAEQNQVSHKTILKYEKEPIK